MVRGWEWTTLDLSFSFGKGAPSSKQSEANRQHSNSFILSHRCSPVHDTPSKKQQQLARFEIDSLGASIGPIVQMCRSRSAAIVVPNREQGSQSIFTGINMRVETLTGRVKVDISCPTCWRASTDVSLYQVEQRLRSGELRCRASRVREGPPFQFDRTLPRASAASACSSPSVCPVKNVGDPHQTFPSRGIRS